MGKNYNAVYSVKGGCGKTAFAIFLAQYLADKRRCIQEEHSKVCLVDVDILGSSMLNTFMPLNNGDSSMGGTAKISAEIFQSYKFINDIVNVDKLEDYNKFLIKSKDLEKIQKKPEKMQEGEIVNEAGWFYIVMSSLDGEKIDKYRTNTGNGFVPNISHNIFKSSFKAFITDEVCFKGIEDIIFDMPPNADGFSSTVFDCIFGKDDKTYKISSGNEDEDRRNLFMVINVDSGHILTTVREIESLTVKTEMKFPTNLFIVINDMFGSDDFNGKADSMRKRLSDEIKAIVTFDESEYESIYFIYFPNSQEYFDAVAGGECSGIAGIGIKNVFDFNNIEIFDIDGKNLKESNVSATLGVSKDKVLNNLITGNVESE